MQLFGEIDLKFEGFLREVNSKNALEKRYALLLASPELVLLPSGENQQICFVFVKMPDESIPPTDKYVEIEGNWEGMDSHVFDNIAILQAQKISIDHWINTNKDNEAISYFVDKHLPLMAEAACRLARWETLASGHEVLEVENGWITKVSPDGTKTQIRKLP